MEQKKEITYSKEARQHLKNGIDKVANSVKVTLGAKGRNVVIDRNPFPHVTKDGVTVAAEINLEHPIENMGARLIKQVAMQTAKDSGDGPQPLYSKILTPTGFVEMGSLVIGQEICGTNNTIQKVIDIIPKGKKNICKVTFSDGRIVECCEDHLWSTTTSRFKQKILTTRQMIMDFKSINKKGDRHFKYYTPCTSVEFKEENLPIDPYLLGLLIGDGSLSGTGSIELSLGLKKKKVLDSIILPDGITFNTNHVERKNYLRVKFIGKTQEGLYLKDYLDELGLLGVRSGTKFIPKQYLYSSVESRKLLIKGLLDTDGHTNKRGLFEFSTISYQLATDFLELCRGLGLQTAIQTMERKEGSSYSNTKIYRMFQRKGYPKGLKIVDIDLTNKYTEMQCIKVSNPDHLYITDHYVVTHNTTSSTVLAQQMTTKGIEAIDNGFNPIEVKKGMDIAVKDTVDMLRKKAIDISADYDILKQVAVISANGDEEVGHIVADVMSKIKLDGDVTIELADTDKTYSVITEGTKLMSGYINQYYITNHSTMTAEYTNAMVFLYDGTLTTIPDIEPILKEYNAVVTENGKEKIPLIIISSGIDGEALSFFTINKAKGNLPCITLRLHGTPFDKTQTLQDLKSVVGGEIINQSTGLMIHDFNKSMFGQTRKIVVNDKNSIIMSSSFGDTMAERIEQLKSQIEASDNDELKKTELKGRIARLIGGIAVIYVGGKTEAEVFEKKDRIDDAVGATKAAMSEGIIAGGGVALLRAKHSIKSKGANKDQEKGIEIVRESLDAPIYQILSNGGYESDSADKIIKSILNSDFNKGFDIKNEKEVDMVKEGIIDPFKVVRNTIENSNSIAGLILTTECVINNKQMQPLSN